MSAPRARAAKGTLYGGAPLSPVPHDWEAAACLDLINSQWSDHRGRSILFDRLPISRFRRALLRRWHLSVGDPDDPDGIMRLIRTRALVRDALERFASGQALPKSVVRNLRRASAAAMDQPATASHDWDAVIAEIAASALRLISGPRVVKVCANPDCSWMFVDESRPRSRRWCNASVCGSLVNVRRFRRAHAR